VRKSASIVHMEQLRYLDLGGGPDWGVGTNDRRFSDEDFSSWLSYQPLHAVTLARSNPDAMVVVLDPQIPPQLATHYRSELPNLHFVEGEVRAEKNITIPFTDASFNRVHMNFGFRPFNSALFLDRDHSHEEWANGLTAIDDVPVYAKALQETGRVLRTGGRLTICERVPNMNAIRRILSRDASLKMDSPFLSDLGLEAVSYREVTDSTLSPQAGAALGMKGLLERRGDRKKAATYSIYAMDFIKRG
jgi:hypothetical protein